MTRTPTPTTADMAALDAEIAEVAATMAPPATPLGPALAAADAKESDAPRLTEADLRELDTERQLIRAYRANFRNALYISKTINGDPTFDPTDVDLEDLIDNMAQKLVDRRRNRLMAERKARAA